MSLSPERSIAPLVEILRLSNSSGIINTGEESALTERDLRPLLVIASDLLANNVPDENSDPESTVVLFCLELFDALRDLLRDSLPSVLLKRLSVLQDGLLPWLHDALEVLKAEQYNEHVSTSTLFSVMGSLN